MNEPDPSGFRQPPPPKLRIALGGADPGGGQIILIDLVDVMEEFAFASQFEGRGWQVERVDAYWPLHRILSKCEPDLVITDNHEFVTYVRLHFGEAKPAVIVVVPNNEKAANEAWKAGADWVVARPIDFINPLSAMPPDSRPA